MDAKLMRKVILAIVEAAEKEGGINNISMIGKKRSWHRCVWSTRHATLFLYNNNSGSTKSIKIK